MVRKWCQMIPRGFRDFPRALRARLGPLQAQRPWGHRAHLPLQGGDASRVATQRLARWSERTPYAKAGVVRSRTDESRKSESSMRRQTSGTDTGVTTRKTIGLRFG